MRCDHTLLRSTKIYPWSTDPIWECVDCGKFFNIEEILDVKEYDRKRREI